MKLDFLVIGAQKGGTTSLWRYLREHPRLCMPRSKEAAFFTADLDPDRLPEYVSAFLPDARADSLLGKVTPDYMVGQPGFPVQVVAGRVAQALPEVKLVSLLRDPIERAASSYTMAVRRRQEKRSIDDALLELLAVGELESARRRPDPTNSYVVAGEYGRMLGAYRDLFPADQLLVTYTEDLGRDPGGVLDAVLELLDLPTGFRPEGLDVRHFRGGRQKLLDPEAEERLFDFYTEEILPHMTGSPAVHRKAFEFFYETWNVAPDDRPPEISSEVRAELEAHFRGDAEALAELGIASPWISHWDGAA